MNTSYSLISQHQTNCIINEDRYGINANSSCQDRANFGNGQSWKRGISSLLGAILFWTTLTHSVLADEPKPVELVVLGIAQDAGFPQAGCFKSCCKNAWLHPELRRQVSCLGLIDHHWGQCWMFDCSPDFPFQLQTLTQKLRSKTNRSRPIDGIFLTHAHIGHYAGLIHLGREVMGTRQVPTYVMPRMKSFLKRNGPWSQLVELENIRLIDLVADEPISLNPRIQVKPFQVPHRDEFSETVGFEIIGPRKKVIYLPDIDKWSRWNESIEQMVESVDIAFLDGTFFENGEIPGRDMTTIPHPFVAESISRFSALDSNQRKKVNFIHFNHTNPVLQPDHPARRQIKNAGMQIATEGQTVNLSSR
ncbi:MAG: MBL fold metallo-hydrolase [Planctomycetota bacterium]